MSNEEKELPSKTLGEMFEEIKRDAPELLEREIFAILTYDETKETEAERYRSVYGSSPEEAGLMMLNFIVEFCMSDSFDVLEKYAVLHTFENAFRSAQIAVLETLAEECNAQKGSAPAE